MMSLRTGPIFYSLYVMLMWHQHDVSTSFYTEEEPKIMNVVTVTTPGHG